jgi:hypothetical protein
VLEEFVADASELMDSDKQSYSQMHSQLRAVELGLWRWPFNALFLASFVLLLAIVPSLLFDMRVSTATLLITTAVVSVATGSYYFVVSRLRRNAGTEARKLEVVETAARQLAERLRTEAPGSDLLQKWQSLS